MAPSLEEVMDVLQVLAREEDLKVTVSEAAKGSLLALGGAFLGGLLGGRLGLAVGGAAGAMAGASVVQDFRSVVDVISSMPYDKKEELYQKSLSVITAFDATDAVQLALLMSSNDFLRDKMLASLRLFITQNMNMQIAE